MEKVEVLCAFCSVFTSMNCFQEFSDPATRRNVWRKETFPMVEEGLGRGTFKETGHAQIHGTRFLRKYSFCSPFSVHKCYWIWYNKIHIVTFLQSYLIWRRELQTWFLTFCTHLHSLTWWSIDHLISKEPHLLWFIISKIQCALDCFPLFIFTFFLVSLWNWWHFPRTKSFY